MTAKLQAIIGSGIMLFSIIASADQLVIENVTVIDVIADSAERARLVDQVVVVEGNRIVKVGPAGEVAIDGAAKRIDASGKFLVPGFWDMHVHLNSPGDEPQNIILPLLFANGISGVRDMNSDWFRPLKTFEEVCEMRDAIEQGTLVGPRFMALCRKLVRQKESNLFTRMRYTPLTEAHGRAAAQFAKMRGVDFIKPYTGVPREAFFGLMTEAKKLKIPVAGHLPEAIAPAEAAEAGMRSIEHAVYPTLSSSADFEAYRKVGEEYARGDRDDRPGTNPLTYKFDEALCQKTLDAFVKHGVYLCPTHTTKKLNAMADVPEYRNDDRVKYIPPQKLVNDWLPDLNGNANKPEVARAFNKKLYKLGLRVTGIAHKRGIPILVGTDAPDTYVFPGFSYYDEMVHLSEAGLSPLEILKSATIQAARCLEKTKDYGSIEAGKMADFLILDKDPLLDIRSARLIDTFVFDGRVHDRKQLKAIIDGVEEYVAELKN